VAGGSAILAIKIIADASGAIKELGETSKATEDFEKGIKGLAVPAAGVAGALGAMTIAAAEDARQQAALKRVYANATGTTDDYSSAIDSAVKAGEAKAFTDNEIRAALVPLITATGDAEEANKLLGPALDIARLAGVDAETAASALAKAHEGQAASLGRLLPGLDKGASASDTISNATKLAAGAAADYAASGPGQIAMVGVAYGELGDAIGTLFLPVLSEVTRLLQEAARWLQANMDIVGPLAVVFGALALAVLGVNLALAAFALLSSPITLLVLGIGAIIAGLVLLWQRSSLFRDIVQTAFDVGAKVVGTMGDAIVILGGVAQRVFDGIGLVVGSVIGVIQGIFAGILAWMQDPFISFQEIAETVFGVVGTVVSTVIGAVQLIFAGILAWLRVPFESFQTIAETVWSAVQTAASTAIGAISTIFSTVQAMLTGPFEAFQTVVQGVFDAIVGIARTAIGIIEGIIQGISDAIKTVSDAVDAINPLALPPPSAGGGGGSVSAMGARSTALSRGRAAEGGGGNMTVNVYGGDPWRIEQAVKRGFRGWTNNSGGNAPTREY
jgi:phage-related protein